MKSIITSTSFVVPSHCITNDELVNSYNNYIKKYHYEKSAVDSKHTLSNSDFIYQASGIRQRFVHDKEGILDIDRMYPQVKKRMNSELSLQSEFGLQASKETIAKAMLVPTDIDAIIVACSNFQRAYPGIAVELQQALGIENAFAIDINAGCASAVYGLSIANGLVNSGMAKRVLVVTPELYTFHLNFKDRKSHFIFGDGCSAVIVENITVMKVKEGFAIKSAHLLSRFSNNIRNNFGFINRAEDEIFSSEDKLFSQDGKKVKEDVVTLVIAHLQKHLKEGGEFIENIERLWLHQANSHINKSIATGIAPSHDVEKFAPTTLDKYANTAASGVIACFNEHSGDFLNGDVGIICAFGAGYSVGSLLVEKIIF